MPDEDEKPTRKRFRWLKRICVFLVVFHGVTIAARIWWGLYADARLREVTDRIRARGEPLEWSEFAPEPVPDDENAALLYKKAVDNPLLVDESSTFHMGLGPTWGLESQDTPDEAGEKGWSAEQLREILWMAASDPEFRRSHKDEVRAILEMCEESLKLCPRARGMEGIDWGIDFDGPAIEVELPPLRELRNLVELVCLAALDAHESDRDAESLELLRDALRLQDSLAKVPHLISVLQAQGVSHVVCGVLEEILPELSIGSNSRAAPRSAVEEMISALLDPRSMQDSLRRGLTAERNQAYDTFERFRSLDGNGFADHPAGWGERVLLWVHTGPMWTLDEARFLKFLDAHVVAASQDNAPDYVRTLERVFPDVNRYLEEQDTAEGIKAFTRRMSGILTPSLGRVRMWHYRAVADRRMAATGLCIRLYQLDNGHRPEDLDQLVARYIPEVPDDPFGEKGTRISYRPRAHRPVLYSVWVDGKDDGGKAFWESDDGESGDVPFYLDGKRPSLADRGSGLGSRNPCGKTTCRRRGV